MSLALKHIIMLLLSAAFAAGVGVAASAFVADRTFVAIGTSVASVLILTVQVVLTLIVKSEEERELSLIRQIRLNQLEGDIAAAEAVDKKIQEEVRRGNLESAKEWHEFRRRFR